MSERWEYKIYEYRPSKSGESRNDAIEANLNNWGVYGWELVGVTTSADTVTFALKRPYSWVKPL